MGVYLDMRGNDKGDISTGRIPNENYAREILQLFSTGLYRLWPDGTLAIDSSGRAVPSYDQPVVSGFARVFTGFWFGHHNWGQGGYTEADYAINLSLHANRHDFGPKTLVSGHTIPARAPTPENARRDVEDALVHLLQHPNTAPFVCRQLIQFLVTDNPTPDYVQRIAALFVDNGSGVRGDLAIVIPALLLDPEARAARPHSISPEFGRLKEPVMRTMALGRAFGLQNTPNLLWWDWGDFYDASRQEPTRSPSVFNFYRPDYQAPGEISVQQKKSPVFQITNSFTAISTPNMFWEIIQNGFWHWEGYQFKFDYSREARLSADTGKLVDYLNLIFCGGSMSPATRTHILTALNQIPSTQPETRAQVGAYLALVSPEGAVMK
jgi:uncharacterized protein (DUF1800 family)